MNKIWIIARRELSTFFDSLMAYILIVVFLGFTGFFTWLLGSDIFFVGQASLLWSCLLDFAYLNPSNDNAHDS
jgi:ABC-2 type transport system permease protein